MADEDFLNEIDAMNHLYNFGHGPKCLNYTTVTAGSKFPYPREKVDILVMTRVPGARVEDIYHNLTPRQLESIHSQLVSSLM